MCRRENEELYIELNELTDMFGVYGEESGYCYSEFVSEDAAWEYVQENS